MNRSSLLSSLFAISPRWRKVAIWAALLSTSAATDAIAQSPPEHVFQQGGSAEAFVMRPDASGAAMHRGSYAEDIGVGGMGILGRSGHIIGQTVGREQSITHFELMPYVFEDQTMFFMDGRFYVTNNGRLGGSGGGGLRHYVEDLNAVLGASVFYDHDDTRGVEFSQIGASFEYLSEWIDVRTNLYKHTQRDSAELGTSFVQGSERFEEYRIVFDTKTRFAAAADGLDMLFSMPVPGELPQAANLEASAGWYHFQAPDSGLNQVWGWRVRLDADWFSNLLHTYLDFTSDRSFNNNLVFGAEVNYYHDVQRRPRIGHSQFNRMSEWVRRNYNVVAIDDFVVNAGNVAINPDNGLPYLVAHVRNIVPPDPNFPNDPGGNGTPDNPFPTISQGQNTVLQPTDGLGPDGVADIVFVHAGSVFSTPIQMNPNQQVLGEGVIHPIRVANAPFSQARPVDPFGTIRLPTVTTRTDVPILVDVVGDAVVFDANDDNSVFAGFDIINTAGNAIVANGVSNITIRDVDVETVTGADSNGLELVDVHGNVRIENLFITNAEGGGAVFDGGDATINWFGGTITNTSGHAVLIEDQTGGTINLAGDNGTDPATSFGGVTITDNGGEGILIQDTVANISFGRTASSPTNTAGVTINNSTSTGVRIFNLSNPGSVNFIRGLAIDNAAEESLQIQSSTGTFTLIDDALLTNDLNITNRNLTGIDLNNILEPAQIVFLGDVSVTDSLLTSDDPAINFHNQSTGLVQFEGDIIASNTFSNGPLINIGNQDPLLPNPLDSNLPGARFEANGNINLTMNAASTGRSIQIANEPTTVQFGRRNAPASIAISPGGGTAVFVHNNSGDITFNSSVNIATSVVTAVDVQDNRGSVLFGSMTVQDATGTGPAVLVQNNRNLTGTAAVGFTQLNITATDVFGFVGTENDSLTTGGGTIQVDGAGAVDLLNNDRLSAVFTNISANAFGLFAIRVVDDRFAPNINASFTVTGGSTAGSGGQISGGLDGAIFENIRTVSLNFQDYFDNTGIAVDSLNAINFTLRNGRFSNNGTVAPNHHVRLLADVLVNGTNTVGGSNTYTYLIDGNLFEDTALIVTPDAMLHIEGLSGSRGSNMNLTITDQQDPVNLIPGFIAEREGTSSSPSAAIRVDWSGNLTADISRNIFELGTGSDDLIGLDIITRGTTFTHDVLFSNNLLRSPDTLSDGNVGVRAVFAGRADMSILNNAAVNNAGAVTPGFTFAGINATGYDLTFRATGNNILFDDNYIDFNGDAGTGLIFTQINTSNVRIGDGSGTFTNFGNQIDLTDIGPINGVGIERGIIFQTTFGTINLSGTEDNVIQLVPNTGAAFIDFQEPANSTGQIIINGTPRP